MMHYKFVKLLIDQLRGDFRESRIRPSKSSSENKLNNKLHILKIGGRKQHCLLI